MEGTVPQRVRQWEGDRWQGDKAHYGAYVTTSRAALLAKATFTRSIVQIYWEIKWERITESPI